MRFEDFWDYSSERLRGKFLRSDTEIAVKRLVTDLIPGIYSVRMISCQNIAFNKDPTSAFSKLTSPGIKSRKTLKFPQENSKKNSRKVKEIHILRQFPFFSFIFTTSNAKKLSNLHRLPPRATLNKKNFDLLCFRAKKKNQFLFNLH